MDEPSFPRKRPELPAATRQSAKRHDAPDWFFIPEG
jgi:hypothetical protein